MARRNSHRLTGALVRPQRGTTPYGPSNNLQERGEVCSFGPTIDVYEGMIVGENAKDNDLGRQCSAREKADQHCGRRLRHGHPPVPLPQF